MLYLNLLPFKSICIIHLSILMVKGVICILKYVLPNYIRIETYSEFFFFFFFLLFLFPLEKSENALWFSSYHSEHQIVINSVVHPRFPLSAFTRLQRISHLQLHDHRPQSPLLSFPAHEDHYPVGCFCQPVLNLSLAQREFPSSPIPGLSLPLRFVIFLPQTWAWSFSCPSCN